MFNALSTAMFGGLSTEMFSRGMVEEEILPTLNDEKQESGLAWLEEDGTPVKQEG